MAAKAATEAGKSKLGLAERLNNNSRRVLALIPPTTSGGMDQPKTLHVRLMQVLTGRNGRLMKIAEKIQSQTHCQASRHVAQAPSAHTHSKALAWIKKLVHHILRHHCTTGALKDVRGRDDGRSASSNASDPLSDFCTRSNRGRIYRAPFLLDRNGAYCAAWPKCTLCTSQQQSTAVGAF